MTAPTLEEQLLPREQPEVLARARALSSREAASRFLKAQAVYGGRRFCVIESPDPVAGKIPVLAIRFDLLIVLDWEAWPIPASWAIFPYSRSNKGAHTYLPGPLYWPARVRDVLEAEPTGLRWINRWEQLLSGLSVRPFSSWPATQKMRDGKYCYLSTQRGYFHERLRRAPTLTSPRGFDVLAREGVEMDGYRWALKKRDEWMVHALAETGAAEAPWR